MKIALTKLTSVLPKKEIKVVLSYARRYRRLSALSVLVLLGVSASEAFGIGMIVPVLQSLIGGEGTDFFILRYIRSIFAFLGIEYSFLNLMGVLAATIIARYGLGALQQYLARLLSSTVTYELRERAFQNLMDLPLSYHYQRKTGDLIATLYTSSLNAGAVLELGVLAVSGLVIILVYIIIDMLISAPLTLMVFGLALFAYFFIVPRFKIGLTQGHEEKTLMDAISSFLIDTLGGIKIVKAFSNEGFHIERFRELNAAFKRLVIRIQVNRIWADLFSEPFAFLIAISLMVFAVQVLHMPLILMIAFFFVFLRLSPQIRTLNSNYLQILQCLPHFAKVEDIIERERKTYLPDGSKEIKTVHSGIEFSGVRFRYPESNKSVLEDVNLSVAKDRSTALVGVSGGGKTTLIDLILRLHDPDEGLIKVDGVDLRELKMSDWHRLIGVVPQEPYLFDDTIYNNILYGKLSATEEEIIRAAKLANAHDFIAKTPQKYQTLVGERGAKLSGGEKQRIALARALVKDPEILILDEATSALDSESERLIKDALVRLSRSKTIIIIAHRLSTIVDVDKIIVIENGRVVEEGTHEELIRKDGVYRRSYSPQLLSA